MGEGILNYTQSILVHTLYITNCLYLPFCLNTYICVSKSTCKDFSLYVSICSKRVKETYFYVILFCHSGKKKAKCIDMFLKNDCLKYSVQNGYTKFIQKTGILYMIHFYLKPQKFSFAVHFSKLLHHLSSIF